MASCVFQTCAGPLLQGELVCIVLAWRAWSGLRGWLVMSGVGLLWPGSAAVVKDGITIKSSDVRGAAGSFLVGS